MKPTVTIMGNGAIGNLLAMQCALADIPFSMLLRQPARLTLHAEPLENSALTFTPQIVSLTALADTDILLLPLKAYQLIAALHQIKPYLGSHTEIVMLHNGLGIHQQALRLIHHPLVAATTSHAAYKPQADKVVQSGKGITHAGYLRSGNKQREIEALLSALLPPCHWHQNVLPALWKKVAINAVINPLTAIYQCCNGALREARFSAQIRELCEENAAIMTKAGITVTATDLHRACDEVIRQTADNFSSMHQDLKHNRPTEIDYINGFIVEQGDRLNCPAPHNEKLLRQIKTQAF